MNQSINLSAQHALLQTLSPQMIQSLKLLQLPTLQLEQLIKQELEINPVLEETLEEEMQEEQEQSEEQEEVQEKETDELAPEDGELKVEEEDINWEEYLEDGFEYSDTEHFHKSQDKEFEKLPVAEKSLEEHLMQQLNERDVPEKAFKILQHLIGSLNVYGYLSYSVEEIADYLKMPLYEIQEAVNILQHFDPPGIGARNLQECLQIQLKAKKCFSGLEMEIVTNHFHLLQKVKLAEISHASGKEIQEVQRAVKVIGSLNPRPGEGFGSNKSQTIIPDIIVEKVSDKFIAYLNDGNLPRLHISQSYARLVKRDSKASQDIKNFVKEKITAANWLIKSIEQRKMTMMKVMNAIMEFQHDFFEKGPALIKPLILQAVADRISMHISTVSRVTNGKYVQTPHGIYELKNFFSSSVEQEDGTEVSAAKAMEAIKDLVEGENSKNPLSDQKLVKELQDKNINIARRTVAKYRERLNILPARLRKQY